MARRRQRKKLIKDAEISNMAAEGKAFWRHNGKVIFVEDGIPGDVADILIHKKKKDYAIGRIAELKQASPLRIEPFCQHFGVCGGCKWQMISYEQQLAYKSLTVVEAFQRIGKLDFPTPLPILGADPNRYYRNKMDFSFSNKKWLTKAEIDSEAAFNRNGLGFHKPGMFDKVVDIEHCYLQAAPSNEIRNAIRDYAIQNDLSFYDIIQQEGLLRNLIIRSSSLGEWMVLLSFGEDIAAARTALLDHLVEKFPQITSLHYVINTKKNESLYDLDIHTYHGRGHIFESLEDLKFKISPKSFFQTNSAQAERLYQVVRDFANLQGEEVVYDLYTGTGSIGLFLARHCKKVVGIEEVEAAIEDAKFNAQLNQIDNSSFFAGDVRQLLNADFLQEHGQVDLLVTDPPRAGMHPDVVQEILKMAPKRIVYVSCNPITQARDLQALSTQYKITSVQPVDMFPHTYHVENVVALERNVDGV